MQTLADLVDSESSDGEDDRQGQLHGGDDTIAQGVDGLLHKHPPEA